MRRQMPFNMSQNSRIYTPGFISNLLLFSAFYVGVAAIAFFFVPIVLRQNLPREAYLFGGAGMLGTWLFTSSILWVIDRWSNWQKRRAIRKIMDAKNLLAAWQYSAMEWQALAEKQADAESHSGYKLWHSIITIVLVGGILTFMAYVMPGEGRIIMLPIGIFLAFMILFSYLTGRIRQRIVLEQNRARRAENPTPRLYISRKGFYHETEGVLQFHRIQNVGVDPADNFPRLSFTIWVSAGRGGSWPVSMFIPIPRQHVVDAQRLAEQLNGKG